MKFPWLRITPLLVPVVPDEYSNAAVSFCLTLLMFSSESDDDGFRFSKSLKWISFVFELRWWLVLEFGPKMTAGARQIETFDFVQQFRNGNN